MPTERRFVFAPDMKKLGERVQAAEKAAEDARKILDQIEDSDDIAQRLIHLAGHVRDHARGLVDEAELQSACTVALDGLEDMLDDPAKETVREVIQTSVRPVEAVR